MRNIATQEEKSYKSGNHFYQGIDNKRNIAWGGIDEGSTYVKAVKAKELKKIKKRAVVSFKEGVDGKFGSATRKVTLISSTVKQITINLP
ncbi:hypothetical protein NXY40_21635 [Phocaeicola vulgatus]|nr:hypothetical protein [Phocaeicola vulgatus]